MSTRWYPKYITGNPQLRVFLPNFFMKLVKPEVPQLPNVVQFKVSMQMTKHDVKNYLEKIYSVKVESVVTHVRMGKFSRNAVGGYVIKDDDFKLAYVTLPKDEKFEFPNLFPEEKEKELDKQKEQLNTLKDEWKMITTKNKHRQGVPSWLGI
ncbi:54S ribosomal protein L23, mitochondrial [Halocaridina rubra]|uniref:Large ribosomal subunit protein uL23m n=1 Tax=Halocaridina rubra TaxID=373956 RepID=A0AAN8WYG8_HALRR